MSGMTGIPEPRYQYCDGGRAAAGFPPLTDAVRGDCVTRGIAIAARLEYEQARQLLDKVGCTAQDWSEHPITYTDADDGLQIAVVRRVLESELGWEYHDLYTQPTFELDRLPMGSVVVMLASQPHLCAVVDRVLYDTYDSTEGGQATLFSYWTPPPPTG
ncbi:hypothetical protein [Mycobacterium marinum]|uniref:hypothetical protein n=1 Tax=Mycobacterium marinum TaxID=1781 RepID=UPI0035673B2A